MKTTLAPAKAKRESRYEFEQRMERDEMNAILLANRAHKAMERVDRAMGVRDQTGMEFSWPAQWQGDGAWKRGQIYALPDVEVETHVSHLGTGM